MNRSETAKHTVIDLWKQRKKWIKSTKKIEKLKTKN